MYFCDNCKAFFKIPAKWKEINGENFDGCPFCKQTFEAAKKCELCGEYFAGGYFESMCENCKEDIKERFSKLLNENFTTFEIGFLNEIFDGKNLE